MTRSAVALAALIPALIAACARSSVSEDAARADPRGIVGIVDLRTRKKRS